MALTFLAVLAFAMFLVYTNGREYTAASIMFATTFYLFAQAIINKRKGGTE